MTYQIWLLLSFSGTGVISLSTESCYNLEHQNVVSKTKSQTFNFTKWRPKSKTLWWKPDSSERQRKQPAGNHTPLMTCQKEKAFSPSHCLEYPSIHRPSFLLTYVHSLSTGFYKIPLFCHGNPVGSKRAFLSEIFFQGNQYSLASANEDLLILYMIKEERQLVA